MYYAMSELTFVDLFCGVGGIRIGMEKAGFKCLMSSEINSECCRTYYANFGERPQGDITKIDEKSIPDHDVLCAGFPCQPFSISGKMQGFEDARGTLFFDICRILSEKKPSVVLLENVKQLVHHDNGKTLKVITDKLNDLGYSVSWRVLNGADYGVPQNRERIIIIGMRGAAFDFDKLKEQPRKRLLDVLDKKGNFEYLPQTDYTLLTDCKQQSKSGLIFVGYRNRKLRKTGVREGTVHLSRAHKQPNRIYSVYGSHPTLAAQETTGRYYVLTTEGRVRKLTLNECWRLMGFPETFKKVSKPTEQYRQLGNSVCIPMIEAVAKEVKKQFLKNYKINRK